MKNKTIDNPQRRNFLSGSALGLAAISVNPLYSFAAAPFSLKSDLCGKVFDLVIDHKMVKISNEKSLATLVNGLLPAPTLYWKEGETVTIRVKNNLLVDSSIHWHGIILPADMDGVPGLSFAGIKPGEVFEYSFAVQQSGTYWYHSHSGFQEQKGVYGAIVIQPKGAEAHSGEYIYDRESVVLLSDWTDSNPAHIYKILKKQSHYYNTRERTVADLFKQLDDKGLKSTWADRSMWNQMRMNDRDISDVTGMEYQFLMNGQTTQQALSLDFQPGEKIMLRVINAAAMSIFDFRIPGLKMTVVAADGQYIQPVCVDEFRIAVAETYDVIVEPTQEAYCVFAQVIDRSGFVAGTLRSRPQARADVPAMDAAPTLSHGDMGMAMDHSQHPAMQGMAETPMPMSSPKTGHQMMGHSMHSNADKPKLGKAGHGSTQSIEHVKTEFGAHVDMRAQAPQNSIDDPGIGMREHNDKLGRYVLRYSDLKNRYPTLDKRQPSREIQLHLTGNMARYMWSFNGIKFADAEPLKLNYGERVRITLVNDTMMTHPIHLHGMWSELETGDADYIPRKHTVIVQPGSKVSYLVTADAKGRWAYHCHLLYHMFGMFREVRVVE